MSFFQRLGGQNIPEVQAKYLDRRKPQPYGLIDEMGATQRDPEPGRGYLFDGVDDRIDIPSADIGTLYVSAQLADGTLDTDISISFNTDHYEITKSNNELVWNVKVWEVSGKTDNEKKSKELESDLFAWFTGEEASGKFVKDISGNGNIGEIMNADLNTFHTIDKTVPFSFANEKGLNKYEAGFFDGSGGNTIYSSNRVNWIHQTAIFKIEILIKFNPQLNQDFLGTKITTSEGFHFRYIDGKLGFALGNGNSISNQAKVADIADTISVKSFNKIKVEGDGSTISLYINNTLFDIADISNFQFSQGDANLLKIGDSANTVRPMQGHIAYVKIENPNNIGDNIYYDFSKVVNGELPNLVNPHTQVTNNAILVQNNVPQNASNRNFDVEGKPLEYRGRTTYNGKVKNAGCIYGDGVQHYADFIQAISLSGETHATAWVQIPSNISQTAKAYLLDGSGFFELAFNNGFVDFRGVQGTLDLKDDEWHFVEFRRQYTGFGGSLIRVYIDEGLESQTTVSDGTGTIERIFANASTLGDYFEGYLLDLRVYDAYKTENELKQIKQGYDLDADLIAHLPLQEESHVFLWDVSQNRYNAIGDIDVIDQTLFRDTQNLIGRNIYKGFTKMGTAKHINRGDNQENLEVAQSSDFDVLQGESQTINFKFYRPHLVGEGQNFIPFAGGNSFYVEIPTNSSSEVQQVYPRVVGIGRVGSQGFDGNDIGSNEFWANLPFVFITLVCDNSNGEITSYVNGIQIGQHSYTAQDLTSSTFRLLQGRFSGSDMFVLIDEASIFKSKFTQAEIDGLYNNGNPINANNHSQASSLIGYWTNQGAGDWLDQSGNGHDAIDIRGNMVNVKVPATTYNQKVDGTKWATEKVPKRNLIDNEIEIDFLSNEPDSPWADTLISINNTIDAYKLGNALNNPLFKKVLSDNTEKNFILEPSTVSGQKLNKINRITS